MADFTTSFAIELEDETSGPAAAAASSLAKLKSKIDADTRALSEMQTAMRRLKGGTTTNSAAFKELSDKISASKSSIASAQSRYIELGGTFGGVATKSATVSQSFSGLLAGARALPAPLIAAAGAWFAFAGAVVAGTIALLRYGVVASDARRTEQLRIEGMMTLRRWHGIAAGSATELTASIDRTAASSSLARSQVSGYAEQLYRAGLRGGTLSKALEAVTMASSVQGDGPARRIAGLAIAAARTGGSVDALADKVKARLGGIAARQLLGLDVQARKLRESIDFLTGGLKIEGFLGALGQITQLLSANTASGRALKVIFEALFNPILGSLDSLGPLARRFFQGMVIAALHLTIAVLRVGKYLRETFGADVFGGLDKGKIALHAGMLVLSMFAGAVVVTAAIAGTLALALGAVALSIVSIAMTVRASVNALSWFGGQLAKLYLWATGLNWSSIGSSVVDGLVSGITSSRARVVGAITGLAGEASRAMRDALGIRSPSRVFAGLGVEIPRGLAQGVEAGAPSAQRAVDGLLSYAEPSPAGGARAASSSMSVSIESLIINARDTSDPGELAARFRDEVVRLLEGASIEMGATGV